MADGFSERVDFLRARIAALEAAGGSEPHVRHWGSDPQHDPRAGDRRTGLGLEGRPCSLDRVLRGGLPLAALHEVVAARAGDSAAATGFAGALAARFAKHKARPGAKVVWILETMAARETGRLYGPGVGPSGLDPAQLVLVETRDAQESLWAMEEALKCTALAAVVGEIWSLAKIYDLAASRRLVLAARKSGTPGVLIAAGLAGQADRLSSGASTRFEIATRASAHLSSAGRLVPLPGAMVWAVRLAKARAGPHGFGFDRDKIHPLSWDPEEACFRDALSLGVSSLFGDRQIGPAWNLAALPAKGSGTASAARDFPEDQVGAEASRARPMRAVARA